MRRNFLQRLLTCLLLLTGISAATAQTTTLISYTNQWSYLVTNALPPGGWTNVNYPAAAGWPVGRGPFAFPAEEAMPAGVGPVNTVLETNFNNTLVTTFYFRTTVNVAQNPSNLIFRATAAIDDGAVFYVNGRRVQNVRMTAGAVSHNTFATGDGGGDVSARALDTFVIPSTNFVQGANVIAVSVHQVNAGSSDVVFGLHIEAEVILPPVIVTHPQSQTVQADRRALFEVEATGTGLNYRWFANGVLVSTTTNFYLTPIATVAMDGTVYHVIVSNVLGAVQSNPAVLRVIPDTFGPVATLAFMSRSNWIELRFDETLAQGPVTNANSLTNFKVIVLDTGETIPITNVTLGFGLRTNVTLRLPAVLDYPTNYVVCAYNMEDMKSNVTASTCIGLGFWFTNTFLPYERVWAYTYDSGPPATNWNQINFVQDPQQWVPDGRAPFFQDQVYSGNLCGSTPGSAIEALQPMTYYFRHQFTIPAGTDLRRPVRLDFQVDDGAVFYLNGVEIYRYNMPGGTVSHNTLASSSTEANCFTSFTADLSNRLRFGNNVLAASVHQVGDEGALNNDIIFDAKLSFAWLEQTVIPQLAIGRPNATSIRVSWPTNGVHSGWILESAPTITGPWTTNAYSRFGQSNIFQGTIGTQPTNAFFRMRNP